MWVDCHGYIGPIPGGAASGQGGEVDDVAEEDGGVAIHLRGRLLLHFEALIDSSIFAYSSIFDWGLHSTDVAYLILTQQPWV